MCVCFSVYTLGRAQFHGCPSPASSPVHIPTTLNPRGPVPTPSSLTSRSAPKSSNSNSSGSASNPNAYADKLGKDGCLTQEEKDRHRKNNLCMFCGGKHKTEDWNKCKAAAPAKGRAAEVEEPVPASEDLAPSELEN